MINLDLKAIVADSETVTQGQFELNHEHWIISNPPYGVRLKQESVLEVFRHLEKVIGKLSGAIILHPESMKIRFESLRLISEIDFANQGLNIKMSLFKP